MSEEKSNLGNDLKKGAEKVYNETKEAAEGFMNEANRTFNETNQENKKILAGILGIVLGSLGIHKFILGYTKEGIIHILLSFLCGLGGIIGLIEGIIYLTKSDQEFYQTYQVGKKPWF